MNQAAQFRLYDSFIARAKPAVISVSWIFLALITEYLMWRNYLTNELINFFSCLTLNTEYLTLAASGRAT
jgi:hypothetical protein